MAHAPDYRNVDITAAYTRSRPEGRALPEASSSIPTMAIRLRRWPFGEQAGVRRSASCAHDA